MSAILSSLSVEVLHLVVDCNTSYNICTTLETTLTFLPTRGLCNSTVHSKFYDRMMILSASICRRQRPCLMNLILLAGRSSWKNSTCMCFRGYVVILRIMSPACLIRLILSYTLIFIAVSLHMNFSIKLLFNLS
jgi:hypothetical protein